MNKSNFVYLFFSFAFLVIFIISLLSEIDAKVILGYSIATFVFSIIDLINTIQDGRSRLNTLRKDQGQQEIQGYFDSVNEIFRGAIESAQIEKKRMKDTREGLFFRLLTNDFTFRSPKSEAKKIIEPAKDIADITNNLTFDYSIFQKLTSSLESMKPVREVSSRISLLLLMVSFVLLVVIPLFPDNFVSVVVGSDYEKVGTYIVLLSLTLLFFTSFMRNYYMDKTYEIQTEKFYNLKSEMDKMILKIQYDIKTFDESMANSSEEFKQLLELVGVGITKELTKIKSGE
ncbi:hypothetical protein QP794_23900 [Paenibacillus sp. UMB7766-LJ446]|uniref:hypothetical protein n=1 Tax=Paenibacillus sp. UMB7766-LJ446 TaxID=3046313 RepID=UPI00254D654B|nr:hypothetical protein [Paenibacillus sp. UMB7766-LJ446]MDK8193136.1 hypothetical protein [Paenibacillus sp. UMB7766-LJ446]